MNLDILISVWARLLMCHSDSMSELVDCSAYAETSWILKLQTLRLLPFDLAHIRIASFCRVALNEDGWHLVACLLLLVTCRRATRPTYIDKLETRNCNLILIYSCKEDMFYLCSHV